MLILILIVKKMVIVYINIFKMIKVASNQNNRIVYLKNVAERENVNNQPRVMNLVLKDNSNLRKA